MAQAGGFDSADDVLERADGEHQKRNAKRIEALSLDAVMIVDEVVSLYRATGRSMVCAVHRNRRPTLCPLCALSHMSSCRSCRKCRGTST